MFYSVFVEPNPSNLGGGLWSCTIEHGYFGGADYDGLLEFCVFSDRSELFATQGEFDLVCRAVKASIEIGEDFG
jgi:hypothetical protein